ncbi:hypothetical protein LPJ75_001282, partial [Coemansia sp. RSA 2598]
IIEAQILGRNQDKSLEIWDQFVDTTTSPFKSQGCFSFAGSAQTDGVAILLFFKTPEARSRFAKKAETPADSSGKPKPKPKRQSKPKHQSKPVPKSKSKPVPKTLMPDCPYVHGIPHDELLKTAGDCVLIDPGRRDLFYCMKETSTPAEPIIYHYTQNQCSKETQMKHFSDIREKVKTKQVQQAENKLQGFCRSTIDPARYKEYIEAHKEVWPLLESFYNETMTTHTSSAHQVHNMYMPTDPTWSKRKKRAMVPYENMEPQSHLLHRKLRLSAYWNQKQADAQLACNLRRKFGKDPVLVMGNWSAAMVRYHEPIHGKGWRKVLKNLGFKVYLLDEFRT